MGIFNLRNYRLPQSNQLIKVGVIAPLSGENAAIGEGIKNGILLASAKYKNRILVIFEDDQFITRIGITAFNKLINIDKVDAVINITPGVADAITPILKQHPLPVIQIAEPGVNQDDTIFQIMPSGAALYTALGEIAKKEYASIAFVYLNNPTFEKAAQAFKKSFGVKAELIPINQGTDYRSIIAKIISKKFNAITLASSPSSGVPFIKQFFELNAGSNIKLLCNGDFQVTISDYLKAVSPSVFEGCKSTFFASNTSDAFKIQYKETYGTETTFASDYAYDALDLLVSTHSTDLNSWIDNIKLFNGVGVSGNIMFDKDGVRLPEIEVDQFQNGKFVEIK
ncbi:MAG: ABC transporter substrate-binding protein [Patescibacteria group bacterium]